MINKPIWEVNSFRIIQISQSSSKLKFIWVITWWFSNPTNTWWWNVNPMSSFHCKWQVSHRIFWLLNNFSFHHSFNIRNTLCSWPSWWLVFLHWTWFLKLSGPTTNIFKIKIFVPKFLRKFPFNCSFGCWISWEIQRN